MCAGLRSHHDLDVREWAGEVDDRQLQRLWDRGAGKWAELADEFSAWEQHQPPLDADAIEADPSTGPTDYEEILDDDAEIARLARLKPLAFEREVKAAAKQLGCRVALLRKLVATARGDGNGNNGQGKPLEFPEIEPWPNPVYGDGLLEAIIAAIQRYVIIGQPEVRGVALWTVAAHCFALFPVFPRLFVTAAEKQCGKTTLLDVLSLLTPRPLAVANSSPAALFRAIAAVSPTLLLDEFDGYTNDTAEELRQIINAGHKRGGAVLRVVGDSHEPRLFDAYSPMAIAAIGSIAGTLIDRSITIGLHRRLASEFVISLRLDRAPELQTLARQIARWATDHAAQLAHVDPAMSGLVNRAADNWRPLFAVAELAGNGWRDLAHDAAGTLTRGEPDEASTRVRLLFDIRAAFTAKGVDRLRSEELVDHLVSLEDRPWPEWGRARKPITKVQVARLLKPLRISPGSIRLPNGSTPKGYYRTAFTDAFARYLAPDEGFL
jgi:putative DNA primase/helicase